MAEQLLNRPLERPDLALAIGMMTAAILPFIWQIEAPVLLFFFACAGLRLALHGTKHTKTRKWLLLPLLVAGIAIVYWQYQLPVGARPGVAFLVSLFGLKLLEVTKRRDIYILSSIAFFIIAAQYLFDNGMLLTLYLSTVIVLLIWLLTTLNRDRPERAAGVHLRTIATIVLPAIPVTLLLFYLFPRLATPLWELASHDGRGVTGLSDSISLGSISELSRSNATAFRVTFDGELPPQHQLYWRGPVLWETDGRDWTTGDLLLWPPRNYSLETTPIEYEVVMEPNRQPWLFALDLPASIPEQTRLTRDFRLIAEKPVMETRRYRIASSLGFRSADLTRTDADRALQLPDTTTDRVRDFAVRLRKSARDEREYMRAVLRHFNTEPYVYTLRPPPLGDNPVDAFLFDTRRGFCEHYATSFVTLMRAAGIPARIVTGYQGGEWNPIGDFLRVRQSDAHAWAEVWFDGEGWIRVDPTAAVAPERVEQPLDLDDSTSDGRLLFRFDEKGMLASMALQAKWLVDSIQMNWKSWVVNFDRTQQRNLLSKLGLDRLPTALLGGLAILIAILATGLFALLMQRLNRNRPEPAVLLYERFSAKLAKTGLGRRGNEGPLDYLQRIAGKRPDLSEPAEAVIRHYIAIRYCEVRSKEALQALARAVRQFRVS